VGIGLAHGFDHGTGLADGARTWYGASRLSRVPARLDHTGFAVVDLEAAMSLFRDTLDATLGPVVEDPLQRVRLCFAEYDGGRVELIAPWGQESPVDRIIGERGGGTYHLCFEVDDLDAAFRRLRGRGFVPTGPPQPAVAFNGRRVVFMYDRTAHLIELVEAALPTAS
jgi:methylmalonyl-CoA/ethylmalonyl-CoA epimerase